MLSVTTWVFILMLLLIVKYTFLIPKQDQQVYKLYEQRDKIAISAMKEEVKQETIEYRYLVNYLNFWIYYTRNDYDFSIVWNNIMSDCPELDQKLDNAEKRIEDSKLLKEALDIGVCQSKRALGVRGFIFEKLFLGSIIVFCTVMIFILNLCDGIVDYGMDLTDTFSNYLNDSKKLRREYREFSSLMNYRG